MDISYIVIVLGVILFSMTLHELLHGLVAYWLGDRTARDMGRLTLNPLQHIDPFMTIALPMFIVVTNVMTGANMPVFGGAKPVPFNPNNVKYDEMGVALVAASGPLVNFVLAFSCYVVLVMLGVDSASFFGQTLTTSVMVNLGFFAFNIIPLPPLDGSRVLYALAPEFVRRGFDAIEQYGVVFVFAIVMIAGPALSTYMSFVITGTLQLFSIILGL